MAIAVTEPAPMRFKQRDAVVSVAPEVTTSSTSRMFLPLSVRRGTRHRDFSLIDRRALRQRCVSVSMVDWAGPSRRSSGSIIGRPSRRAIV